MPPSVELHYQQYGAGSPVVILHGLFGSSRNWQSIARKLADDYAVTTVDLRNHGSSPHVSQMNYAALSADVSALLEKLALRDVTLIGHSMGGKAAMTLALTEPDRVARLIIVDIGPGSYADDYDDVLKAMMKLDLTTISRRTEAHAGLVHAIPEDEIRSFVLQNLLFSTEALPRWRINLPAIAASISDIVGAIPCDSLAHFDRPTYFFKGEKSARITERELFLIAGHFPAYELIAIADAGHWPHTENPEKFLAELRQVLA